MSRKVLRYPLEFLKDCVPNMCYMQLPMDLEKIEVERIYTMLLTLIIEKKDE
jgi:hypothetical protein